MNVQKKPAAIEAEVDRNETAFRGAQTPPDGCAHYEAFALLWYGCPDCKHQERVWNSRDGDTPVTIPCPSCGGELRHVYWHLDTYAPNHHPRPGQVVIVTEPKGPVGRRAK